MVSNRVTGMRTRHLVLCLLFCAPAVRAGEGLPRQFGKWAGSGPVQKSALPSRNSDQEQAILLEAGITGTILRQYSQGNNTARLRLRQFRDSSGAYEAFTFLRTPDMIFSDVSPAAAVAKERALLQTGNYVLEVDGLAAMSPADLQELAKWLAGAAEKTPLPPIRGYLPGRLRLPGTERYALGPIGFRAGAGALDRNNFAGLADAVGFSGGAEAMLARYRQGGKDAVVLLLQYPTPQSAARFERHIEQALASTPQPAESAIRRTGSLLSLVLQPASHEYANALLDDVRYETNVTWNEPSHELTDPPWSAIIVNTILGTGVFLVAAVAFGIAFGGVRVITKIFLPGKVFDRADRMEILQLGISSKPIDARDFYSSVGF